MPFRFHVDIVSAEDSIFHSEKAEMIYAPAQMGEVGIAPHHAPLLTLMNAGDVRIEEVGGKEVSFFIDGGILEVQPGGVTILSDTVLRARDINEKEAMEAKRRAEEVLKGKRESMDYAQAHALLTESLAKLRVVRMMKTNPKE